jgi:predicted nucleic acid-binding protein
VTAVFVDTSAFYSLADRNDTAHAHAARIAERLRGDDLVTTDLVLAESWLLTRSRLGRGAALRMWQAIRGGAARVETIRSDDLDRAWQIAGEFRDQDFSLIDCASFALIERLGIRHAFSFDRDFTVFRFGPRRRGTLQVVGLSASAG